MNATENIGVFYSPGQNFPAVLKHIRKRYPNARVEALVPRDYPDTELIAPLVDEVIRSEFDRYPLARPQRLPRLVKQIQQRRYQRFVVLFDSLKQRWLCAVSKAPRAECWSIYGRVVPLEHTVPSFLAAMVKLGFGGKLTYLYIWCAVHLVPARAAKPE